MLFDHENDLRLPYLSRENIWYKFAYREVPVVSRAWQAPHTALDQTVCADWQWN